MLTTQGMRMSSPLKVVLLTCGSFNPPTNMHFRMFELARDTLHHTGQYKVIGGVMSVVHDAYGKKDLLAAVHRTKMIQLSLQSSDWLFLSEWESQQEGWTPTRQVISYHQNQLNSLLTLNCSDAATKPSVCDKLPWLNEKAHCELKTSGGPVQVKFLCGADVLESFAVPGLWKEEDIEAIIRDFGMVVMTRAGSNPERFIYESDILSKYQNNIHIATEWIANEVSSTKIRRGLRRGESIKYLIPDAVLEYIQKQGLYSVNEK